MKNKIILTLLAICLVSIVAAFLGSGSSAGGSAKTHSMSMSPKDPERRIEAAPAGDDAAPSAEAATAPAAAAPGKVAALTARIARVLATLRSGSAEQRRQALDELDEALFKSEAAVAITAIMDFLATGQDAATGEEFVVGPGGVLPNVPSLRVMLLDQLGVLCRENGTGEAVAVAREITTQFTAPDEWAVCLRNAAWLAPTDTAFLRERTRTMLSHEPWVAEPSRGFLEAFDLVPFTVATDLAPMLAHYLEAGGETLGRAATVALDRLAAAGPAATARTLNDDPAVLAQTPLVRADLMAKADVTQPAERAEVERYLARPDVSADEKEQYLATLITPGAFVSDSLLTAPGTLPSQEDDVARLKALRGVFAEWLAGGRFEDLRGSLDRAVNDPAVSELIADSGKGGPR